MTYELYIGDKTFSSWSLRGWLMLEKFGLAFEEKHLGLYSGTMKADMAHLEPAKFVPVLRTPDGHIIGETLAIAETLAERHPEINFWPQNAGQRATARWLCAEMTSGFSALRSECPMQLQHVNEGFVVTDAVQADLARIEELWAYARAASRPWLFGDYSLADVFYAPVCARIIGYDLPVSSPAKEYCLRTISDPAFRLWRRKGQEVFYDPFPYPHSGTTREWPVET